MSEPSAHAAGKSIRRYWPIWLSAVGVLVLAWTVYWFATAEGRTERMAVEQLHREALLVDYSFFSDSPEGCRTDRPHVGRRSHTGRGPTMGLHHYRIEGISLPGVHEHQIETMDHNALHHRRRGEGGGKSGRELLRSGLQLREDRRPVLPSLSRVPVDLGPEIPGP